jgi:hypothetical protein
MHTVTPSLLTHKTMKHMILSLFVVTLAIVRADSASSFVVIPAGKGLSPGMDVMAVAGELQAR